MLLLGARTRPGLGAGLPPPSSVRGGLVRPAGVTRAAESRNQALAGLAEVRELGDELRPPRGVTSWDGCGPSVISASRRSSERVPAWFEPDGSGMRRRPSACACACRDQ
eukprot:12963528-Heterocapsa_arctica.AAC.1